MAKYKSTLNFQGWKQHRCAGCGALYRYLFRRHSVVTASSPEKAQTQARANLGKIVTNEVDQQPCPHCGVYQPDMSAQVRRVSYNRFSAAIWVTLVVVAIISASHGFNIPVLALAATVIVGVCALGQAWAALRNDNGDLIKNRQTAEAAVAKGAARLDQLGASSQPQSDLGWRRPGPILLALLAVGVLALPLAEGVRRAEGWPLNDKFYPPVAGPGDRTTFYMPEQITSLKSYWRGRPSVHLKNAEELGQATDEIAATANENTWSGTISVKASEQSTHSNPWVQLSVPGDAKLANKTARLRLELATEYPQMSGTSAYQTVSQDFAADAELALAAPGAGAQYTGLWYGGLGGSCVLLALATWLLRRHARKHGRNTQAGTFPLE